VKIKKKDILIVVNKNSLLDINYYFSSEKLNIINRKFHPKWYKKNLYYSIGLYFLLFFKKLLTFKNSKLSNVPVILVSHTKNQRDALAPLLKKRNDCKIFGEYDRYADFVFPTYKAYAFSATYFFEVYKIYKSSTNYIRLSFQYAFHEYWVVYGYFIMLTDYLKKVQAQIVIVSNDHTLRTRIIPYVCTYIGIKSVYIQHASASERFPRLIFDYALLEGRDSLDKYMEIGKIDSEVFLIGTLKESNSESLCTADKVNNIGICFNLADDLHLVESLIIEILKVFDCNNIFLRPHPRDDRDYFTKRMKSKYSISISNSREQISIKFLKQVECIIASESNIHLEATLQNVVSIYYKLTEENNDSFYDSYGFIGNKLIENVTDANKLKEMLRNLRKQKPNVRYLAKYYNETIESDFEGKSDVLYDEVISYIKTGNCEYIDKTFNLESINGVKVYSLR